VQNKYPSGVFSDSPKSKALYYFKQSLRYKDVDKAAKYLEKYFQEGGTARGIEQSLQTMSPLYGLSAKKEKGQQESEQEAYYNWLNERDREKVREALQYYDSVVKFDPKNKVEKQIYEQIDQFMADTVNDEARRKEGLVKAVSLMITK
jgi:predicted secreted Zn-dependent protease